MGLSPKVRLATTRLTTTDEDQDIFSRQHSVLTIQQCLINTSMRRPFINQISSIDPQSKESLRPNVITDKRLQ